MAYLLDDQLPHDARFRALRRMPIFAEAFSVYTLIGIHCASERNDGRIFRGQARGLAPSSVRSDEAIAALLAVGFLIDDEAADEYVISDFLDLNESRAEMLERRRKNAEKQRKYYSKHHRSDAEKPNRLGDESPDRAGNQSSDRPPVPSSGARFPDLPAGDLSVSDTPKAKKPRKPRATSPSAPAAEIARVLLESLPQIAPLTPTTRGNREKLDALWAWASANQPHEPMASIRRLAAGASVTEWLRRADNPLAALAKDPDSYARRARDEATTEGADPRQTKRAKLLEQYRIAEIEAEESPDPDHRRRAREHRDALRAEIDRLPREAA